jgi:hypothetical protein
MGRNDKQKEVLQQPAPGRPTLMPTGRSTECVAINVQAVVQRLGRSDRASGGASGRGADGF